MNQKREKMNLNTVGVAAYSDPHFEGNTKKTPKTCLNLTSHFSHLTSDHNGITLIALIITIIIMLILVGLTVAVAINGGLFTSAKLSSFATEMQRIKENVEVKKAQIHTKEIIEETPQELFTEKLNKDSTEILDTLKKEILYIHERNARRKEPSRL